MKLISRAGSRIRIAAALAMLAILLSAAGALGWRAFHQSTGWDDPAFVAAHIANMRAELARVHRGKVNDATLRQILNSSATHATESPAADGAAPHAILMTAIADYLAGRSAPEDVRMTQASYVADSDAGATSAGLASSAAPASPEDESDRTYVGQKTCEGCHGQEAANWAHTIHAAVFTINPRNSTEAQGCEACHGPGSDHVKNPSDLSTIISFSHKSLTPVARQNAQCLSCHQGGQRIFWHGSIHENNNLACSDCHNPMSNFASHGLTARDSVNQTCFSCHKIQRVEFGKRSHMPLLEGKISCVDCHNPHGSTTSPLLKADSVNEVCYGCHAEKRGPFLFEHAPVRENCLNCHNPHGSDFEALLTAPRPMLCQQCHAQDGHPAILQTRGSMVLGGAPNPMLISTSCQTCHVNIHGSNDPSGSRFER